MCPVSLGLLFVICGGFQLTAQSFAPQYQILLQRTLKDMMSDIGETAKEITAVLIRILLLPSEITVSHFVQRNTAISLIAICQLYLYALFSL
jgi:hypothetical protein